MNISICDDCFCNIIDFTAMPEIASLLLTSKFFYNIISSNNRIWKEKQKQYGYTKNPKINNKIDAILGFEIEKLKQKQVNYPSSNKDINTLIEINNLLKTCNLNNFKELEKITKNIFPNKPYVHLLQISQKYLEKGNLEEAKRIVEKTIDKVSRCENINESLIIDASNILKKIAQKYLEKGNLEEAKRIAEKIITKTFLCKDSTDLLTSYAYDVLKNLVQKYLEKVNLKEIEKTAEEKNKDLLTELLVKFYIFQIIIEEHLKKGNLKEAERIAEKIINETSHCENINKLSNKYYESYEKFLMYKNTYDTIIKFLINNKTLIFQKITKSNIENGNLREAERIAEKVQDSITKSKIFKEIANSYLKNENLREAERIAKEYLKDDLFCLEMDQSNILKSIALIYLNNGNLEEAKRIAKKMPTYSYMPWGNIKDEILELILNSPNFGH